MQKLSDYFLTSKPAKIRWNYADLSEGRIN